MHRESEWAALEKGGGKPWRDVRGDGWNKNVSVVFRGRRRQKKRGVWERLNFRKNVAFFSLSADGRPTPSRMDLSFSHWVSSHAQSLFPLKASLSAGSPFVCILLTAHSCFLSLFFCYFSDRTFCRSSALSLFPKGSFFLIFSREFRLNKLQKRFYIVRKMRVN